MEASDQNEHWGVHTIHGIQLRQESAVMKALWMFDTSITVLPAVLKLCEISYIFSSTLEPCCGSHHGLTNLSFTVTT